MRERLHISYEIFLNIRKYFIFWFFYALLFGIHPYGSRLNNIGLLLSEVWLIIGSVFIILGLVLVSKVRKGNIYFIQKTKYILLSLLFTILITEIYFVKSEYKISYNNIYAIYKNLLK
jgi:hypothetical protein